MSLPDGLIIIIIVVPRSRVVAEMKPYARRNVHADARTMVAWPIADVIVVNVTPMVWPITYVVLRHAASPVVIHAASAALGCFGDRWDSSQGSDPHKQCSDPVHCAPPWFGPYSCIGDVTASDPSLPELLADGFLFWGAPLRLCYRWARNLPAGGIR